MDDNKTQIYLNRITNHINNWINKLELTEEKGFKTNNKSINNFINFKIKYIIKDLIRQGKDHLLTEEFCYYLIYNSLKMVDYQKQLIKLLNEIKKANNEELTKILNRYISYVCFGDIYKFDQQENYIKLMNNENLEVFNTCMNCINNMYKNPIRGYESKILTEILFNIYSYCVINKKLDRFNSLVNKYFADPRKTIDYFINNGFIDEHYDLIENFNEYIYNNMYKEDKKIIIK